MSMRGLFGSLLVAMTVAGTNVSAGEFVEIEGGTRAEPVRLVGYMARPAGAGPFSAVVLLHGCGGFHSSMISWADRLSRFGYAALAIDRWLRGAALFDDQAFCSHHGFDLVDLSLAPTRGVTAYGHRVEYNEEATKNAIVRVRDFLRRTMGVQ